MFAISAPFFGADFGTLKVAASPFDDLDYKTMNRWVWLDEGGTTLVIDWCL